MQRQHKKDYESAFAKRIHTAALVNRCFGRGVITDPGFYLLKIFPPVTDLTGRKIHGEHI